MPGIVHITAMPVGFGQGQRRDEQGVVDLRQRPLGEILVEQLGGFLLISGQEPLIDPPLGLEDRLVPQQNVQEGELRNVLADHQEADGQGRCQQQSGNSPQPRPENGRHQDRHARHAGALAIQPGLHDVPAEEFHDRKQP